MTKKVIIILFIIIYLFAFSLSHSYEIKKVANFELEEFIKMGGNKVFYNDKGNFVAPDVWEKQIIEFDTTGKVLKKIGGEGEGPGFFKSIFSITKNNNKYYIVDNYLYRISILDKDLNFRNSFMLRNPYQQVVLSFGDTIITIGHNFTNPFDQMKDYYIANIFIKDNNDKYVYQKNIIPIKKFTNYNKIRTRNKDMKSAVPIPNICATINNDIALILYDYLPEIILYNPYTEHINKININFAEYINPLKVNYKIINKFREKIHYFGGRDLVFSPQYFCYDDLNEIFIIQYKRPYKLRNKSKNKHLYQIIIFDKEFNYRQSFFTNLILKSVYRKNKRTFMLFYKNYDYTNLNEIPPNVNYFEINEFK